VIELHRLAGPDDQPAARSGRHRHPPILLVNALYDPSTSYAWAVGLAEQMPTGVLVTRDGDGHTSYLLPGTSQTRDAIDQYLLTGDTPPPGTIYPN
jgi:hypothetical protein